MDGNDLNPVINTNGPTMRGPDPEPKVMPMTAAPNATAETVGTMTAQSTGPAVITSDASTAVPSEKSNRTQKIIAQVLVAVCAGLALLALAITVLTNIPRIATLENQIDGILQADKTMQEQIAALNKRIGYDIDVEFFDGGIPGKTYTVMLQPDTREATVRITPGCSLPNEAECPEPTTVSGTLSTTEYNLVVEAYENTDGSATDYTSKMLAFAEAILSILDGDTIIADAETSDDWGIIKIYDADNDDRVSSREYGTYMLSQMTK